MPFVINVTYDRSVNSAPAAFKSVVSSVVHFFESKFSDPVTINIDVGYGEVDGHPLSAGALGQSLYVLNSYTYSQIRTALVTDATTADDLTAIASLSTVSPVAGNYWVSQAEAKALGLLGNTTNLDGYVGFAAGNKFDCNLTNGVTAGLYDFYGVVAHEISEIMGRELLVGATVGSVPHGYTLLDLFHYSSAGHRDFVGTQPGYFSINSGVTNLDNFNTSPSGDFGDWATSAGRDAFRAFSAPGVINAVSATDLRELDILGWDPTTSTSVTVKSPTSISAKSTAVAIGHAYGNQSDGGSGSHRPTGGEGANQFNFRAPINGERNLSDFHASPTASAHLATEHLPYDAGTRALVHDPDGTDHAATHVATPLSHPAFAASDFLIG
jgi:hypothetical protein